MSLGAMADPTNLTSPFPDSHRVIYGRNPLNEVICQLRFPPILRIAAEPPVSFQESIRVEYPLLRERREAEFRLPAGLPTAVAEVVKGLPKNNQVAYDFTSEDGAWKITLARDFLALSTSRYTKWESFRTHLQGPLKSLLDVYKPAFFGRVGLRYQDLIRRSALQIPPTTGWAELMRPQVTGMLATDSVGSAIEDLQSQVVIKLAIGKVAVKSGIVETADETHEQCFLIDMDFFNDERTATTDVDRILGYFNRQSGRLFRWSIGDHLHNAMEPQSIEAPV